MRDFDSDQKIRDHAWNFLIAHRTLTMSVLAQSNGPDDYCGLIQRLVLFLGERGRGVLALLGANLDWDAEIVLRSYYECASKILYLTASPAIDRARLVEEFEVVLAEAGDKKRARKAKLVETSILPYSSDSLDVFRLLGEDLMVRRTTPITKKDRQAIEARWSFSGIIDFLTGAQSDGLALTEIKSLHHAYGMASHLIHSDSGALDLMEDRARRDPDELAILEAAHRARIVNDLVSLGLLCSMSIGAAIEAPKGWMKDLMKELDAIDVLSRSSRTKFHDSQRAFYDRMFARNQP